MSEQSRKPEQSTDKHTPLPWHVDDTPGDTVPQFIYDANGMGVADTGNNSRPESEQIANAELIVKSTNAFDQILSALKAITTEVKSWHDFHHGSTLVQCDSICALIPQCEAAIQAVSPAPRKEQIHG
jgi:hypothetical protein